MDNLCQAGAATQWFPYLLPSPPVNGFRSGDRDASDRSRSDARAQPPLQKMNCASTSIEAHLIFRSGGCARASGARFVTCISVATPESTTPSLNWAVIICLGPVNVHQAPGWSNLCVEEFSVVPVLQTQVHGRGSFPFAVDVALGKWERLESYARYIIEDMNHWVTGWMDWNLALDMQGGPNWAENFVDAPIIVNKEADEFYKNPMFYAMGHFSKFVKEGATKLGLASENQKKLDATAFRNPDGSTAVVILNR
ncbi:hypothetical protein C7M84_005258 [Penaeus vannamei]|uniref:Glucosylceramidase n=1 Tax=Penaeus vannamei TaxID=6689 RepID=A0A3R7MGX1_PENVA|nr:hypothetical protein C7M84_005258 [Penaeus vannamei]